MECNRVIQKLSIAKEDGLSLFQRWMTKLDEEDLVYVSCVAQSIWLRRNTVVFEGKFSSPAQIVHSTLTSLEAFHQAQ